MSKVLCFTVHIGTPVRAARICQYYRGFAHVGRPGPQTVRSGQKVPGKIRYFRTESCAVPEREARSAFGPATPIEKWGIESRNARKFA